ncbi:MAG: radical SAM protein [Candidatus Omnitrophica bacterium]|nr:radical SAM protein [Candidatus Omnitrophota bacterium]MDD5654069.1 radical SAM protein [Candidatus Omnitrophota bacterium]
MEHIDFHVSYTCVNNCIFCSSSDAIAAFKGHPLKYEQIINILKKKRKHFKSVNFTGGEPSLLEFLPALTKEAGRLGYKVYIGTNGAGFSDQEFCRKALPFINEICFSVHGDTAKLHDLHTGNKGSFKDLKKAMDNVSKAETPLFSNTVVTKYNFPHLKGILEFLISRKVKQALLSNLAPEGRGLENYKQLAVRLGDIRKTVSALVNLAKRGNMIIRFFGIPACVLGEHAAHSNDFFWDSRLNIEQARQKRKLFIRQEKAYFPARRRIKVAKCAECLYKDVCGGVFEAYYDMFKDAELEPVRK